MCGPIRTVVGVDLYGEKLRFEEADANEIGIARAQLYMIERCELLMYVLGDGLARKPLVHCELRVYSRVGIGLIGVGKETALGVGEDRWLWKQCRADHMM